MLRELVSFEGNINPPGAPIIYCFKHGAAADGYPLPAYPYGELVRIEIDNRGGPLDNIIHLRKHRNPDYVIEN